MSSFKNPVCSASLLLQNLNLVYSNRPPKTMFRIPQSGGKRQLSFLSVSSVHGGPLKPFG